MSVRLVLPIVLSLLLGQILAAQFLEDPPILVGDSGVGYIDSAILGDQVRFRYESANDIDRPNRSEFIWAWPPPDGDGPPLTETSTSYQSLTAYLEHQWTANFSGFVEVAGLLSNPVINDNTGGLGDMNLGCKISLLANDRQRTTLQTRLYLPTGDADRTLGTNHVSLEPALLHYQRLGSLWTSESELRYFVPLGGTENRRGSHFRYGTGLSCLLLGTDRIQISQVTEFVGWTVLDGQSQFLNSNGDTIVEDADGDTIVNGKFGMRCSKGANSMYAGYGRALTGDVWYKDVLRVEWRRSY